MNKKYIIGTVDTVVGTVNQISTLWSSSDLWSTIKVRWSTGRMNYSVKQGLYAIGTPNADSDIFVSANYKLSFDHLRRALHGMNAWVLVLDTKGINVWCAAGKKTFSTENIIKSIKNTSLEQIIKHRKIIVPQLGAPGVAAHEVKEKSGFSVIYGPVLACDIKPFIENGYKATPSMRKVNFTLKERAKLIPVDLMYGKYKLMIAIGVILILSGIDKTGFSFSRIIETGSFSVCSVLWAYIAGIVITPLMLPYTPFRAFALKGAIWGTVSTLVIKQFFNVSNLNFIALGFFSISIASFAAMNFTGSSTYTSLSGVKKEMKWSIPLQIAFAAIGIILFIISKLV
ncbi:MAG: acetyl-CoA synthase subunit gamma [Bacteroidales bacterium]|nr:acetyl-CoA synthase subunit gamma [Bacteroidales bacterium]